ncbi:UUP1 family membrane protein [Deltaproteobacteria bacterium TL4]
MNKLYFFSLSFCLFAVGMGLFLYKLLLLDFPLVPSSKVTIWDVEARIRFEAENKAVRVSLYIPTESKNFAVTSEHFVSGRYGIITENKFSNRKAKWSIRIGKGRQNLYYRAVIQKMNKPVKQKTLTKSPEFDPFPFTEPSLSAARILLNEIYAQSSDQDSLVGELFKRLKPSNNDENIAILLDKKASLSEKIEVAVGVLALAGIPARSVHGFFLSEQSPKAQLIHWLEIYYQQKWQAYDPVTGSPDIPDNYLVWWRGSDPMYQVKGGTKPMINITVRNNEEEALISAIKQGKMLSPHFLRFSLFSLPIQTQMVYHIILLIPLGALLVVILRNVIGIKTFGTFMPVLVALAFRETELLWGCVLFTLVVTMGLVIRFSLENLKLLVVPRLASILTIVVILMMLINVFTYNIGVDLGLSISLFPMVILTMTIERMSIVWEERGPRDALQQGVGTMLVSILAYLVMTNSLVSYLMFTFPELLLVLLACTILLGRYSGYRLLELHRFKELTEIRKI